MRLEKVVPFYCLDVNTVKKDFIDEMFHLYNVSPMTLCRIFRYMSSYDSWDTVNYIVSKFDPEELRSCYEVHEAGTQYEYTGDPLSVFYTACHVTRYWGKVHPGARECLERLLNAGCITRYNPGDIREKFLDNAYHIKWQHEHNMDNFSAFRDTPEYQQWLMI